MQYKKKTMPHTPEQNRQNPRTPPRVNRRGRGARRRLEYPDERREPRPDDEPESTEPENKNGPMALKL